MELAVSSRPQLQLLSRPFWAVELHRGVLSAGGIVPRGVAEEERVTRIPARRTARAAVADPSSQDFV